ncbi:MAG: hypothetical protein HY303_16135 [Candidatus Wallbacteria bacterium]|nr:hypothetical protein [Candidatus Wallbacteria bacterium]
MTDSRVDVRMLLRTPEGGSTARTALNALFGVSVLFLICVGVAAMAMGAIKADEVGILVNNLTGRVAKLDPGTVFYNSIVSDLYVLDRRQQTVEMKKIPGHKGEDQEENDEKGAVKVKTIDGSDVSADIIVNYTIDPEQAVSVIEHSGPGDLYKRKWVQDYARSVCRNVLGELTTEDFYDSQRRDVKAQQALVELNKALSPWNIQVTAVQVQDFNFYHEYEEKIREKKLADQEVEEQKSQAKAATERQKRVRLEVESKVNVEIAQFKGEMEKRRVEAEAQAGRYRTEADAYSYATRVGADARYYQAEKRATGILATRKAEADGTRQLAKALEGGRNLVLLEYARKLGSMRLTGSPVFYDTRMERLQHFGGAASRMPPPAAADLPTATAGPVGPAGPPGPPGPMGPASPIGPAPEPAPNSQGEGFQ